MLDRKMSRARLGLVSSAVIALLVLSTGSVAADTGPIVDGTFTQHGKAADAYSGICASNGDGTTTCSNISIMVFAGKMSDSITGVLHTDQVCVYLDSYTADDQTGETVGDYLTEAGCDVDLPNGTLRFGRNLSSVTLARTTISIAQITCVDKVDCEIGPSRDVTVVGEWTGVGPTVFSKFHFLGDDGTCRFDEAGKGYSRESTFSGSVDGLDLGDDAYGSITDGRSTFRSRCVEI